MATVENAELRPKQDYAKDLSAVWQLKAAKTALIVVDMQYSTGCRTEGLGKRMSAEGKADTVAYRFDRIEQVVVPNLQRLLAFFREHKMRVLYLTLGSEMPDYSDLPPHMQEIQRASGSTKGNKEHEILEDVKPAPGELVMNKTTVSALNSTGIESALRAMGMEYLVFGGVSTNMCVDGTARDAADRGFRCLLVEDCCGAAKEEYHNWALINFQRLFGRVETLNTVTAELERDLARA